MSRSPPFRRWAIALVLCATAAASIATSPPDRLSAFLEETQFTLTAEQPVHVQRLRVRLELDSGLDGRDAGAVLQLSVGRRAPGATDGRDAGSSDAGSSDAGSSDAGSSDAGSSDAGPADAGAPATPGVLLVVRDEANPGVELYRGDPDRAASYGTLELMGDCSERTCEQTLLLEWSLGEGTPPPLEVYVSGHLSTDLAPDEGTATLEWVP